MSLFVRDNRVVTAVLRDGAPTAAALDELVMANAGGYFTQSIDVGTFTEGIAFLYTTDQGGTSPTLDVNLQYSHDGKHFADSGDSFAQITTGGNGITYFKKFAGNFGKYIRFRVLIGGTATPTYKVTLKVALKG